MSYEIKKQWNPPRTYKVVERGRSGRVVKTGLTHRQARELTDRLHTCAATGKHFDDCEECLNSLKDCAYPNARLVLAQFEKELSAQAGASQPREVM